MPIAVFCFFLAWVTSPLWLTLFCRRFWHPRAFRKDFGAEVVHYEAPKDLRPIEALVLLERRVTNAGMASVLFDLSWRGYLMTTGGMTRRRRADDADLRPYEAELLKALFRGGEDEIPYLTLANRWVTYIQKSPSITSAVSKSLTQAGYVSGSVFSAAVAFALTGVGLLFVGVTAAPAMAIALSRSPAWMWAASLATVADGLILIAYSKGWISWTPKGWERASELRGYRNYLMKVVPSGRWEMGALTQFGPHLPYAYAFGRAGDWYGSLSEEHGGEIIHIRYPLPVIEDTYEKKLP